ncbi:MAG: HAD-IA family hydrolase [Gammaproteobacteria bacterium]|nr:HAD-IA family hydrolase [Gammaproteobacteria bacterium]MDH5693394.1 HAD-IA family hydrolase [Gammaproteobacteria bacterium]
MAKLDTILFDLDGTLADTAPDLAQALNLVLAEKGRPTLSFEDIRPTVSHGGRAMIERGFGFGPEHEDYEKTRLRFLEIYLQNIAQHTRLFDGMNEFLKEIEKQGLKWGVVTNKPSWLTNPLMTQLALTSRAACIISGDSAARAKPHPEPMIMACEQVGTEPERCVYIGDAQRDIDAGLVVGMRTLVALFGYLQEHDKPETWGADAMIDHPQEAWQYINQWRSE